MIVIAPHPTEELRLLKLQKELLKSLFVPGNLIYAHQPLWIKTDFKSVEEAKESITGVTLTGIEYDENSKIIMLIAKVAMGSLSLACPELVEGKGPFIHIQGNISNVQAVLQATEFFPMPLKIFRLGECTSPSPGVYELNKPVWKKLT